MKFTKQLISVFWVVFLVSLAQRTTAQITFDPSVMVESRPYAPVSGTTLSSDPNVLFGIEAIVDSTSLTYLKSMSLDTSGNYDGFFLVHKFNIGTQRFKGKVIHFADFSWEKNGLTVLLLEAYGGTTVKWSMNTSYFAYRNRSSRWIFNPSITYKQFTFGSWVYNEFGNWSLTMGAKWKSPELSISKKYNLQVQAIYNDSWTKRLGYDGFGQNNTISLGAVFTHK